MERRELESWPSALELTRQVVSDKEPDMPSIQEDEPRERRVKMFWGNVWFTDGESPLFVQLLRRAADWIEEQGLGDQVELVIARNHDDLDDVTVCIYLR